MIESKNNFSGGLDFDNSLYKVGAASYIEALNITRVSNAGNKNTAILNVVGNQQVAFTLPTGTNTVIGAIEDETRNVAIFFVWNSAGVHSILEYNNTTRTITKILQNITDTGGVDILGFTQNNKITSINIYNRTEGDLLSFLDSLGRPTGFNITSFKAGAYTPVSRDIIDVAKRPPLSPPTGAYANATTRRSNKMRNRLFRFSYRYVYPDFERSVFSPVSTIPIPANILDDTFTNVITNNNLVVVTMNSGAKNVAKIELAMSYVNKTNTWSDFVLVDSINMVGYGSDLPVPYYFYNDGVYPPINIAETLQLFDYIPDFARAQDLANGNVPVYGNITEGYNRDLVPNVTITVNTFNSSTLTANNSTPTFSFSNTLRIGLVYFDQKGKTNGVLYSGYIGTPAYAESSPGVVSLPYVNTKIYHTPPDWAYSYQWVMTKTESYFKFWYAIGVHTGDPDYLYFNVSNFGINAKKFPTKAEVLSYTFQDGDRFRLIKRDSDSFVFDDTYDAAIDGLVVDPKINGVSVTGTFLKIKKTPPFSTLVNPSGSFFTIQIYRPTQQTATGEKQVYFEIGEQYAIVNPTFSSRYHKGKTTDQNIAGGIPAETNIFRGDAYFRVRSLPFSETGMTSIAALDRNFVDSYVSEVNDIDGRPNLIDVDAKKATYETMVRFGQAYQANTNINGMNRFYGNNFDEYDATFGAIKRLKVRDRGMRVFQEFKVGNVPIYNQISKSGNSNQLLVVTDKLLNPIQYYIGNYGIGNAPESLAAFNFADYFCDPVNGAICRVSNNGVEPISILYNVNSMAQTRLSQYNSGAYKIYGVCQQSRAGNYIIAMEATATLPAYTISFSEDTNSFETPLSYTPEMMVGLNSLLISFKNGALYTHDSTTYNNFFGVQYDSFITMVFNQSPLTKKQPMSLTEVADTIWDCPLIETSVNSYGTTKQQSNLVAADFQNVEGEYHAPLLQDINTGGINNGDKLKGEYVKIKFRISNTTTLHTLEIISLAWNESPLNKR